MVYTPSDEAWPWLHSQSSARNELPINLLPHILLGVSPACVSIRQQYVLSAEECCQTQDAQGAVPAVSAAVCHSDKLVQ